MTDVLRPMHHGGSSNVYHTDVENCYVAQRLLNEDRGKWIPREIMDAWGWQECKRCTGEAKLGQAQGTQLADQLKAIGEKRYPNKGADA